MKHYTTMTTKGQITIPANIRQQWQIKAGQKVQISIQADGSAVVEPLVNHQELRRKTSQHLSEHGFTSQRLRSLAQQYQSGQGMARHIEERYDQKG